MLKYLVGILMNTFSRLLVVLVAFNGLQIAPATAQPETSFSAQPYYKGVSVDGTPIRKDHCGINFEKRGWIGRDFPDAVRGELGVSYGANKSLSVTALFRFSDEKYGKFEILPEEIRLYVHPTGNIIKPSSVERKPFDPSVSRCDILQKGEWVTLNFPVEPERADQVAVIFPSGTVSKAEPIDVRPFRFERLDNVSASDGIISQTKSPISVPALPPVSPRFASFESASAMPNNVKGAWIVDGKSTEEVVAKLPRPPHADRVAQWFALASGYMALYTYEFDGNTAKASFYGTDKASEFVRVSDQERESTYVLKDGTSSTAQTLSVSMLKNGNLRIVYSGSPAMSYLRWKPGKLKAESTTPDDAMAASKIWLKSLQSVIQTLKE